MGNFVDESARQKNKAPDDDGSVLTATQAMDKTGEARGHLSLGKKKGEKAKEDEEKGHYLL